MLKGQDASGGSIWGKMTGVDAPTPELFAYWAGAPSPFTAIGSPACAAPISSLHLS